MCFVFSVSLWRLRLLILSADFLGPEPRERFRLFLVGHARAGAGGVCACGSLASALPSAAAADTGQFRERCIVTCKGGTEWSSERSERGSVLFLGCAVVRERSELDNAKRERHSVVIGGGGGLCVAWGCKVSSFLCMRWGMSKGTSRFLPVYLVEAPGESVEFFEPWQEWLPRTAIFDFLGLKLDNLFRFEDSVTVESLGGGCVLCVFDFYVGDVIAFRQGGLVAAVREPRF